MKQTKIHTFAALMAVLMVSGCSNDVPEPEVRDGKYRVGIGTETESILTVASRSAEGYTETPSDGMTLGIFVTEQDGTNQTTLKSASYDTQKQRWNANLWLAPGNYAFTAYSPQQANVTYDSPKKCLTFHEVPAFGTTDLLYSIGASSWDKELIDGQHTSQIATGVNQIKFRMNRLLAHVDLKFKLNSDKYDALRRIEITQVTLSSKVANSWNILCNYANATTQPTFEPISGTLSNIEIPYTGDETTIEGTGEKAFTLEYQNPKAYHDGGLYLLPQALNEDNEVAMDITYNIYEKRSTTADWVCTRQGAKATNNHLAVYRNKAGKAAPIEASRRYTLTISVVPSYLYVLADKDQNTTIVLTNN